MLRRDDTVLVVIDVQEKLFRAMHEREPLGVELGRLVRGARLLELPVLWLEQNPAGLGPTIPEVASALTGLSPISKVRFSAWGADAFRQALLATERKQALLAGIEAHVCVYQTARDLVAEGFAVEVVSDAVSSRTAANRQLGLARAQTSGADVTSVEMALFELLGTAAAPEFKDLLKLVK